MKLNELAVTLTAVLDQLTKAKAEILGKISDLEAALVNVELPEDAQVALAALVVKAQALDDVVPDVEPIEPEV